ncbi:MULTISPECIES: hypothetical protein [unclassified Microcoleus]|uniref:hypothetical protein n=1 Tax=unclassified Microcoleus TaxID=2642155 RepID=UPI001D3BC8BC|nr:MULTISPECIES: hypothetical protein [unclassified Microcoleus]MCC3473978.1 hypothetical protein [Microcoleus sp. PH2017_13_LAR_U_A]MCC3486060.1 hypothetical protein [Microcoleus sp. PH2017_14_LAR_D_A]MCC3598592.1 hypothetical protein [Microcoleus sp. PH2017_26_ELK_O_A]MCC3623926.1 hypothetical protein [Microcoleus sp. PH2017_36_ELK_O_B]
MSLINSLIKLDIAILVAIVGLAVTIWQHFRELKKEQVFREKQKIQEIKDTSKRDARIEGKIDFFGERLDRIEMWITSMSGFKGEK